VSSSSIPTAADIKPPSRLPVVVVIVAALLVSAVARNWAMGMRKSDQQRAKSAQIGGFDSYALALLLGGLRGPLVMALWTDSETRKSDRRLEDFDTQVEWIRLLQPEFDTVHIFQIWNKAYNVSVQMASLSNKYTTILDAIEYANAVDAERPNNVNVLIALGQVWGEKLGNSFEKDYFRARVRSETLARDLPSDPRRGSPGWRRSSLDPMLDARGMLLPSARERYPELAVYEPFPYGVSPQAIALSYYLRSQELQSSGKQQHLQLSDIVIDSRPAVTLKFWGEEEWLVGRDAETRAFGGKTPEEKVPGEAVTASLTLDAKPADPKLLAKARYSYALSARLAADSLARYEAHTRDFPRQLSTYSSHKDVARAQAALMSADAAFLAAMTSTGAERDAAIAQARKQYAISRELWSLVIIRYYITDEVAGRVLPPGITRFAIEFDEKDLSRLSRFATTADALERSRPQYTDENAEARDEYAAYATRSEARLRTLSALPQAAGVAR
jgi:type II secretory pathway pseudopilin PulG